MGPRSSDMGGFDRELAQPIRVRRPRRWGRWFVLAVAGLVLVILVASLIRVVGMRYPVVATAAEPPADRWRLLRGVVHWTVAADAEADALAGEMSRAFEAGLDFVVLAAEDAASAAEGAANAPLAVIAAQRVCDPDGCYLAAGTERLPAAGDPLTFDRVRRLGGWTTVVQALDTERGWRAWGRLRPDAFEFLDARHQIAGLGPWGWLQRGLGGLLGSPAGLDHLGRRPVAGLAHWDDYSREGVVHGLCGVSDTGELAAPLTYLLVRDGLGPYGPADVAAALRAGHHFCALPFYGDAGGFRFLAVPGGGGEVLGVMGDRIALGDGVELVADLNLATPDQAVALVLYQDGVEVARRRGGQLVHRVDAPGCYRVEAETLGGTLPWGSAPRVYLYSNPIFVESEGTPFR